jgi:hypothetical protein
MRPAADRGNRTGNAIILCVALLALAGGVALLIAGGGVAATVGGILLIGLAGIGLVSLVFLIIGQGEDRDRLRNPRG